MNEISKAGALCKLHEIAHQYLVGPGSWPIAFEHLRIFRAVLRDFELEEDVPDMPGEFRSTALGNEVRVDLFMAFVGDWELSAIPGILLENGLMSEVEALEIWESTVDEDARIHRYVRRAYLAFCNRSKVLN